VFPVHMTSLFGSSASSCCRIARAARIWNGSRRHASFWSQIINSSATVAHGHDAHHAVPLTPEKVDALKKDLVKEMSIQTLELRADLLDETLKKQGFWASLRQALQEGPPEVPALTQAVQDMVNDTVQGEVATRLDDGTLSRDYVVKILQQRVYNKLIMDGTVRAQQDATPQLEELGYSRERRRQQLEDYGIYPGSPEWTTFYKGHKQSEVALATGVPDECIDDPWLHIGMMKYARIKELYNIKSEQEEHDFVHKYDISHGVLTLEAAFGPHEPIPEHTFEELPVIKEPEPEQEGKAHH